MGIYRCWGVLPLPYALVSGAKTRHRIWYYKTGDDFDCAKKCDVQTRAHDKTKPNLCKTLISTIVQLNFYPVFAISAENRY